MVQAEQPDHVQNEGVDFETFKDITGLGRWAEIEERSGPMKDAK